jgi:hypothetical protein
VSDEALLKASRETYKLLTTKPHVPEKVYIPSGEIQVEVTQTDICNEIERTVKELFPEPEFTPEMFEVTGIPSTSASFERSRNNMGGVGEVLDELKKFYILNPHLEFRKTSSKLSKTWQRIWSEEDQAFKYVKMIELTRKRDLSFRRELLLHNYYFTHRRVKIVPLAEALKVRVITKGPALSSYLAMPFQKYLHDVLRRHPVTQLIGTPVTENVLKSVLGRLHSNEFWLNGDYQDATNRLFSYISGQIADCLVNSILKGFDRWTTMYIRKLFQDLLVGHDIEDPENPGVFTGQENGQLMGSVLSFPVLCIANIVLCRMAYEIGHQGQRVSLLEIPLLVNGDDCVFPATKAVEQAWRILCKMFGMLPSVGKCYCTRDFININSTTFLYRPGSPRYRRCEDCNFWHTCCGNPFIRIHHVNWGLIMLRKRSGQQIEKSDIFSQFSNISSYSKDLLESVPSQQSAAVYELFIRNYGAFAAENGIRLPWFVPRCWGGVGIYPFMGWQPSPKDGAIVSYMRGKESFRVNDKDMIWSFHKLYNEFFKDCYQDENGEDGLAYREWNKYVFLSCAKMPQMIFNDTPRSTGLSQLRQAERTWRRYLHKLRYVKTDFNMWSEQVRPSFYCFQREEAETIE